MRSRHHGLHRPPTSGGKKDAKYTSQEMPKFMIKIDPKKQYFMQIHFDGASNYRKLDSAWHSTTVGQRLIMGLSMS